MSVIHKNTKAGYSAEIPYKGRMYWLGVFDNKEDALQVCEEADKHLCEDFLEWYKDYCIRSGGFLTERQEQIYGMWTAGMRPAEIAKNLGCTSSSVLCTFSRAKKKIAGELFISRKIRIDYSKYAKQDMSALTNGERRALELKIKGLYDREISEQLGTSLSVIGAMISNAVSKLDGTYQKEKIREYNTNYKRKHPQKHKELSQEQKEKRREYQKLYKRKLRAKKLKQE